jgi:uncharacterized repeat protein (TIGR02543 family)
VTFHSGESFAMGSDDLILYALWTPWYSLTYDPHGGTDIDASYQTKYGAGDTVTVLGSLGVFHLGYTFTGWGTFPWGGRLFQAGDTFSMPKGDVILYAQWKNN